MAKKNEFRPDKPYSNWLSKLHLTQLQKKNVLMWCLFALVLVVLSVLQDVVFCRLRIQGGTTELVPCGIFLITIVQGTQKGSIFCLVASVLYLLSGSSPGPHSMVLITILSLVMAALRQGYLRQGFPAALLCTAVAMALYELGIFAFCLLLGNVTVSRYMSFVVPATLSLAAVPFLYPISRAIGSIGGETWKE